MNNPVISAVIIGRNEGERLHKCIASVIGKVSHIVYVDSGSEDNSVSYAENLGVTVVELDMNKPFTAARGRNTGFEALMKINPDSQYVQFVDGDCELADGWIDEASDFLNSNNSNAIVCGRLRERYPDASIYNRLCHIEWNGKTGEIDSCGGIFMIRSEVYRDVGGMNPLVIAGEEPEMCLRIRLKNWKISRISHDMGWHDANMKKFSQWWKRSVRSGYAYILGASIHGKTEYRHFVQQTLSILYWGFLIPLIICAISYLTNGTALFLFGLYPLMIFRIYIRSDKKNESKSDSLLYSINCIIAKFPQMIGMIKFCLNRLSSKKSRIIEYK